METTETRVTSSTGGEKGSKPQRMDLLPPEALLKISEVYHYGAQKYDDNNWAKGYDWHLSYAAAQRHMNLFWSGEDIDPESGLPHLAHAAFHMMTLLVFMEEQREFDDRRKKVELLYGAPLPEPELSEAEQIARVMNEAPEGTIFFDDDGDLWKRGPHGWAIWHQEYRPGGRWFALGPDEVILDYIDADEFFGVVDCTARYMGGQDWGVATSTDYSDCIRRTLRNRYPNAFE